MFYVLYFYINQEWKQFDQHIENIYPTIFKDYLEFDKKENSLTGISTRSFSISISREKNIIGLKEVNIQYNSSFNCCFWADIIRDSPVWQEDIILVTNDLLKTFEGDFVLTSQGDVVMIQRKNNEIYVDENQKDYYPFDKLTQRWTLSKLNE